MQAALAPSVAFIGGGQMAGALIGGMVSAGVDLSKLIAVDPGITQRDALSQKYGVRTLAAADQSLAEADVVIWAVKPQVLAAASAPVLPFLKNPLHISIAAGVASADLALLFGTQRVIRVMPNTPALIGAGVTGLLAMAEVTEQDRHLAQSIFSEVGEAFWVESDDRIDAVTAISGSGPAYFFAFVESLQAAAQQIGFDEAQARKLALLTGSGAIAQALTDSTPLSILRERVTSKRGTTAAALDVFKARDLPLIVNDAVQRAYARARALSLELSPSSKGADPASR